MERRQRLVLALFLHKDGSVRSKCRDSGKFLSYTCTDLAPTLKLFAHCMNAFGPSLSVQQNSWNVFDPNPATKPSLWFRNESPNRQMGAI